MNLARMKHSMDTAVRKWREEARNMDTPEGVESTSAVRVKAKVMWRVLAIVVRHIAGARLTTQGGRIGKNQWKWSE
jgi:hypothetical protein